MMLVLIIADIYQPIYRTNALLPLCWKQIAVKKKKKKKKMELGQIEEELTKVNSQ